MKTIPLPLLALILLGTLSASPLRAAGVITNCNEASLLSALEGGGTVTFSCDSTIYLANAITISEDTVLDGNGHSVSISGGGSNRVFHVQTNVHFTLSGIAVIDGFSTNGAGLYNDGGNVTITNCSFLRNHAVGIAGVPDMFRPTAGGAAVGGGLFNAGDVTVVASIFENNEASGGAGGAMPNHEHSGFFAAKGGEATGGGIFNVGTALITDTFFRTNTVEGGVGGNSGAFYSSAGAGGFAAGAAVYNSKELTISNCVFVANSAHGGKGGNGVAFGGSGGSGSGGATYNKGGLMRQSNTSFMSNRALGGNGGWGSKSPVQGKAYGGAHFNEENGSSTFTQCSLIENCAEGYMGSGGACHNATGIVEMVSCNVISNRISSSNWFPAEGGGIYNQDRLSLLNSTFESNVAQGGHGFVSYIWGTPQALDGGDANGGAIFNLGNTAATNCAFANNAAISGTGATHAYSFGQNGKATGAGISNHGDMSLVGSEIFGNFAKGYDGGGAGIFTEGNITSINSTAFSNTTSLQTSLSLGLFSIGAEAFFLVTGENIPEIGYEWFSPETNLISGEAGRSYRLVNLQTNDLGVYRVHFEDNIGKVKTLSISMPASVMTPPESKTATAGQSVTFSVAASGFPLSFQWFFDSAAIPNATGATYAFTAGATSAGTYSVVVSNPAGSGSASAVLNMPPAFTAEPQGQIASPGDTVRFHAAAGGTEPFSYQWQFNGGDISGATDSSFVISPASNIHNGNFSVIVSNAFGEATSTVALLSLLNLVHWQKSDGTLARWEFNGTEFVQSTVVRESAGPSPAWRMLGLNDFDDDGQTDYLWRKTDGTLAVWFMNQTDRVGTVLLRDGLPISSAWRFVGFGDFNGDTRTDIVWQNVDRRLAVWFMDGTNFLGSGLLRNGLPPGVGWRAMGVHDFDHDDHGDILLQHNDGRLAIWKMNQTDLVSAHALRDGKPAPAGWRVAGLSDFNSDGDKDILLRNKDGRLAVWFLDEIAFVDAVLLRNGPAAIWRVVGVR